MAVRYVIRKEATPEQQSWRARIAANEKPPLASFLAWVAELHQRLNENAVFNALVTRSAASLDHIMQSVAWNPDLTPAAADEAVRTFETLAGRLTPQLHLSFDLRDPNFERMVQSEQARLVREVSAETRRAIANVIGRGYQTGTHPYDLAPQIRELVGLTSRQATAVMNFAEAQRRNGRSPEVVAERAIRYARKLRARRAQTIARTETARAMVSAKQASWRQAADRGLFDPSTAMVRWSAVQQDPQEVCAQLDGREVPFGGTFDGLLPPAHPNCLPGSASVLATTDIRAATKRWYDGDLIVIRTASGRELSCTPNHPVLTPNGWIAPRLLDVGGHVVSYGTRERVVSGDGNHKQMPSRIEDVAEAFLNASDVSSIPVPVSAPDFHGDGEGSEVAVIGTDRLLRNDVPNAAIGEHGVELKFVPTQAATQLLARERDLRPMLDGMVDASRGVVSGDNLSGALLARHALPFQSLSLALISDVDSPLVEFAADNRATDAAAFGDGVLGLSSNVGGDRLVSVEGPRDRSSFAHDDPSFSESLVDHDARDTELARELSGGFAGRVFADEVIGVDVVPFHGFVYNLETSGGFYVAEGVMVHNCRCDVALVLPSAVRVPRLTLVR